MAREAWYLRVPRGLALALSSAVLLGFIAFWPGLGLLAYVGLVPWTILYTDDRRPGTSLLYFVIGSMVYWMMLYHPSGRYGWYVLLMLSVVMGLGGLMWAFAPLVRMLHGVFRWPRALSVPVAWVATEWLRSALSLAHFEYQALGYSQAPLTPVIQIADVTGVYGVSFLVAAVNGMLADLWFAWRDADWSLRAALRRSGLRWTAAAVLSVWVLTVAYGALRMATIRHEPGPRVTVVQPSIRHTIRNVVGVHLAQVLLTERRVADGETDLIVWPENAILDDLLRPDAYLDDLGWLAARKQAWLLLGAAGRAEDPAKTTNGVFLIDDRGRIAGRYDKQLLVPFSEYVPGDALLQRARPGLWVGYRWLIRRSWGFLPVGTAGDEMVAFELPWQGRPLRFAAVTCSENIYPPIPAQAIRAGARFMAHLTSEGEAGGSVYQQMLHVCLLRAVENRVSYVRAGNTGISCFIDATGRVRSVLQGKRGGVVGSVGTLTDRVPLRVGAGALYPYTWDAFAKLCLATALAAWGVAGYRRLRRGRRSGPA